MKKDDPFAALGRRALYGPTKPPTLGDIKTALRTAVEGAIERNKGPRPVVTKIEKQIMRRSPIKGEGVLVRLQPAMLKKLDAYRGDATRPEAIRQLIEAGLK